ncbi:MAG: HBL/NHE enterotoxin family protein [Lewinellaceae bacterium]|nr:HBL/NHE enterotoxin family protein [Lewinellaceae bacterium]
MLAPDKTITEGLLIQFLKAYQSVTLAAVTLQQSQFFPLTPTPDWMKNLQASLASAQSKGTDWLINQGPIVASQTPHYFVTYSNSVQVLADNIQNAATVSEAIHYLQWLKSHVTAIPASAENQQKILNDFSKDFQKYRDAVETALDEAAKTIKSDQVVVAQLQQQIEQLYQDIAVETSKADGGMTSIATTGISLSFGIVAVTFAVLTAANPAFPIIGAALAIGGLTIAAITTAINEGKIEENLKKIKTLKDQLLDEDQAIVILQGLQPMLNTVDKALVSIQSAIDMSSIWSDQGSNIDDTISELQHYTDANFKTMPEIASLPDAAKAWGEIAQVAINIEKAVSGMVSGGVIKTAKA